MTPGHRKKEKAFLQLSIITAAAGLWQQCSFAYLFPWRVLTDTTRKTIMKRNDQGIAGRLARQFDKRIV